MWEGFFTGYLNYGLNCREKIEEIISRNSLTHYKRSSSFTNKREAAWLHLLPNLSRYRRMSERVQHEGSARHSTTGDVYCMRAVPVTPRQVMFTVCRQCPLLHAEGLMVWHFVSSVFPTLGSVTHPCLYSWTSNSKIQWYHSLNIPVNHVFVLYCNPQVIFHCDWRWSGLNWLKIE